MEASLLGPKYLILNTSNLENPLRAVSGLFNRGTLQDGASIDQGSIIYGASKL